MGSNESEEKHSRIFDVLYNGLKLKFELFTIDYIYAELKKQSDDFESIHRITIPDAKLGEFLRDIYIDGEGKKYHFFSYIKFFEYEGQKYGLVGGKTNYPRPDIAFDYLEKNDNRISRTFLNSKQLQWSREIIILNHMPGLEKNKDDKQAKFIECFVQRKFNLFDS